MSSKPVIKKDENVAIFIDGLNLERSMAGRLNNDMARIDYDRLIPRILNGRNLSKMVFLTEGKFISAKFRERMLDNFGAECIPCGKGADVPLAINALLTAFFKKVDTIIICSGDRDFISLLVALKTMQLKVEVCGIERHIANDFSVLADKTHYIRDEHFIYNPNHNQERKTTEAAPPIVTPEQ